MISEENFIKMRQLMLSEQIISRGVSSKIVIDAMMKVERHKFVPQSFINSAYDDSPLPIGEGQTISQPYMVAVMTEYMDIKRGDKVLEIGTGSGYQTAILAEIASEVYTVERNRALSLKAEKLLKSLGYSNIFFKIGDGTLGWSEFAPFDQILVTAGAPLVPQSLPHQLSDNGVIVIPVGDKFTQMLKIIKRENGKFSEYDKFFCCFVPLIGDQGWMENK